MDISELHEILLNKYGDVGWWPGDSDEEILIGAILTQNTSWSNVEKAINMLKMNGMLSLSAIANSDPGRIAPLIRSSGYYNQKGMRLFSISKAILDKYGSLSKMRLAGPEEADNFLMSLKGIGRETCDSILNYALDFPVFVVDKYTLRIFRRTGIGDLNIDEAKDLVYGSIGRDTETLKNLHGMIVFLGKDYCKTKPDCGNCPVNVKCLYFLKSKGDQ